MDDPVMYRDVRSAPDVRAAPSFNRLTWLQVRKVARRRLLLRSAQVRAHAQCCRAVISPPALA